MPRVSIFLLNYNCLQYLDRCINSFLKTNSFAEYEIIVIDNKSTDASLKHLLDTYGDNPRVRIIPLSQNYGFNLGFTKGIEIASPDAKYLAFSSIDLFVEPDWLNEILRVFELNARVGVISPVICDYDDRDTVQLAGTYLINANLLPLTMEYTPNRDYEVYSRKHKEPYSVLCPLGPLFVCESEVFRKIGGFDPVFFLYGEELDLGLRMWLTGHRVLIAPNSRAYHDKASFLYRSQSKASRRRRFVYLFHRNVLRTLVKCVPTRNSFLAIPLSWMYLLFYALTEAFVLRDSMIVAMHTKAVFWNLKNASDTLVYRYALKPKRFQNLNSVVRQDFIHELRAFVRTAIDKGL